ncbi:MAG TPA: efflux transporter outer membrane subunit [Thermoanaerobaculia bacterium]|nr:efflux transporter outer membrane subunit [Thermoanaerobaculia bacterium]
MKRALLITAFLLAGCTVGPNYQKPVVSVPEQFHGTTAAPAESIADAQWFDVFGDPVLRSLIDEALRNGYDVRVAAARVEQARARYGIAGAARYPDVDYEVRTGYGRQSGETGAAIAANAGAFWEVDLWGRIRRLNEAARAQYLASEEGERAVRLALASEVASAYFDLRELDRELVIARETVDAFQKTLDLFDTRLKGGTASGVETSRAEALLANAAAQIPLLEREILATENQISVLAGRVPGPIGRGAALEAQPLPAAVPAGLPSALLLRRPDVRASEQALIAANANVGVAEAAFYPTLSLTGILGGQSSDLSEFFNEGRLWNVQAGLLGPIFNAGRLRNQRRVAVAQFEEALAEYEQSVTRALADASTSIVSVEKLAAAEAERQRALRANEEAVRLVRLRYESGFSAYFEVLDAMQQLFAAQNNLARTRRDRLVALVQLYRALGGGWQNVAVAP